MRLFGRRGQREQDTEDLSGVRVLAEEDVTRLGEELTRLDGAVERLDEEGRLDYQRALDAYEAAQRMVPRLYRADEISGVVDTLTDGRYALARVRSRLEGGPSPDRRTPCFFDPGHGPAARDVLYTAPGRGTRTVPACAQDAARVAEGDVPSVRTVRIGQRTLPYWEAGAAVMAYERDHAVGGHLGRAARSEWPPEQHHTGDGRGAQGRGQRWRRWR
ncbi:MAG: hypothetical protein WBQ50_05505 [Nocardioides sp.]